MNSRDKILKKLRNINFTDKAKLPVLPEDQTIYRGHTNDRDKMLDQFLERQKNLSGEVYICKSIEEMTAQLGEVLKQFQPASCLSFSSELIDTVFKKNPGIMSYIDKDNQLGMPSPDYANFEAGITSADFLIARTGSIILNSLSAGGRRLSVLPPVHIVLAKETQLVASLDAAFASLTSNGLDWSFATIITGPSRTSDIEKKLVLGAHGPKRLITLILSN